MTLWMSAATKYTGFQDHKILEIIKHLIRRILAELSTTETLNHPNIKSLFYVLETPKKVNLVTQSLPGRISLDLIMKEDLLRKEEAMKIFGGWWQP